MNNELRNAYNKWVLSSKGTKLIATSIDNLEDKIFELTESKKQIINRYEMYGEEPDDKLALAILKDELEEKEKHLEDLQVKYEEREKRENENWKNIAVVLYKAGFQVSIDDYYEIPQEANKTETTVIQIPPKEEYVNGVLVINDINKVVSEVARMFLPYWKGLTSDDTFDYYGKSDKTLQDFIWHIFDKLKDPEDRNSDVKKKELREAYNKLLYGVAKKQDFSTASEDLFKFILVNDVIHGDEAKAFIMDRLKKAKPDYGYSSYG